MTHDYPFETYIPVLPLRNTVVLPGLTLPIRVGRPKSVAAVEAVQKTGGWILTVSQRNGERDQDPEFEDFYHVGTLSKIEKMVAAPDGGYQILVRSVVRYRLSDFKQENGMIVAKGGPWPEEIGAEKPTIDALVMSLKTLGKEILSLLPANTEQLSELIDNIQDPVYLMSLAASNLEVPVAKKQDLLEMPTLKDRALALLQLMSGQKENLQVQWEIRDKLSHKLGKMQREGILREQLKAIREELGEEDEDEVNDDYREKIEQAGMPEEVEKIALSELKRLEAIGNASPEAHVIRNYLDLLCAMPWNKAAGQKEEGGEQDVGAIDLEAARRILDADHYGMEKIKKRMIQHLAVMKLKGTSRGSILLFVGPPGVGKTSLGQSIAKALGRKFVRASLGGVRDDAEIRGHRRTYIGAMPGRIIQGIKRAGERNPVFMLDEIDKLGMSFQGDPASALLEVLDPEQNNTFMDHYLDVPFDLSQVFFIATANTLETIPGPLRDRLEIIELGGYTTAEKVEIAKAHLVPKQLKEHGLDDGKLVFPDEVLHDVIAKYTREAGVRELQRQIATVCRVFTEKVVAPGARLPLTVRLEDLDEALGTERFVFEVAEKAAPPGVVTGLAWTPMGGEILFIESTLMPGKGHMTITGQLGDVMKESAQIALSLVRSRLALLRPGLEFDKNDLHIHVPAGAIPKDGPSAGIAMLTSIASLFMNCKVDPKLAMTGEVTLRGTVMPIGGVKEKVLAAHRAGIKTVILPRRNEKDLRDVPEEVKRDLSFHFVDTAADVLKTALGLDTEALAPFYGHAATETVANGQQRPSIM